MNRMLRTIIACGLGIVLLGGAHARADVRTLTEFARQLQATVDTSQDLKSVLEPQQLKGACDRHVKRLDKKTGKLPLALESDRQAVTDMLRCGKWIFFSADFASDFAIPQNIITAASDLFGDVTGPAWTKLGLIENPYEKGMPLGFVKLEKTPWGILSPATGPARGISCAACHFGQMPDGRYSVGMPNQKLDFGRVNAMLIYSAWRADSNKDKASYWPSDVQAFYEGLNRKLDGSFNPARTLFDVAQLVSWLHATDFFYNLTGASRPIYEEAASWLSGTPNQYYASSPLLPIPGKTYWMSSPAFWDMKAFPGDYEKGLSRPLSNFAPAKSAEDFASLAYIFQTGNADYAKPAYVDPLVLYFRSLKTPENLEPLPVDLVSRGSELFQERCQSCHNGVDGESLQAYPAAQLGTPEVIVDPLLNYKAPKKSAEKVYQLTVATIGYQPLENKGIYARRLKGIYARTQLMINGGVKDLADAFCLNGERGVQAAKAEGLSDAVHLDLCRDHSLEDKKALIAFLKSWD